FHANGVVGPPHYSIDLPAMQKRKGKDIFGVSLSKIKDYWERLLALPPDHPERVYGMLSTTRNCNAVVVEALMAGDLWRYADPPDNTLFQDARTLLRWVEKAREQIEKLNNEYNEIVHQLHLLRDLHPHQEPTIPTLQGGQTQQRRGHLLLPPPHRTGSRARSPDPTLPPSQAPGRPPHAVARSGDHAAGDLQPPDPQAEKRSSPRRPQPGQARLCRL